MIFIKKRGNNPSCIDCAKIKYPAIEECPAIPNDASELDRSLGESDPVRPGKYVGKRDGTVVYRSSGATCSC